MRTLPRILILAVAIVLGLSAISTAQTGDGGHFHPSLQAQIDALDERVSALEQGAPPSTTTPPTTVPSTTSVPASTSTTTAPPPSTTVSVPPSTTAPPSGECDYPTGPPPNATELPSQRLSSGQTLSDFIVRHNGSAQPHGIMPPNVNNTTVQNGAVYAEVGDNIKLGNTSTYRDLFLQMAPSGGHLDALQGQGATGVTVDNVTIEMTSHSGVTGAILMQNLVGGGGFNDVTFDFNCVRIINSGPFGFDVRVGASNGRTTVGTLTNFELDGGIILMTNNGGTCRFTVDTQTLQYIRNNGCDVTVVG